MCVSVDARRHWASDHQQVCVMLPAMSTASRCPTGSSHDYDDDEELPPLTPYLVDKALDEVRPYLIADGGNVEVAAVQDGVVMLRLQGACGTCPSSTATMKMGIERSLRVSYNVTRKCVSCNVA